MGPPQAIPHIQMPATLQHPRKGAASAFPVNIPASRSVTAPIVPTTTLHTLSSLSD